MVEGGLVLGEAFADFPGKVEAGKAGIFLFEFLDDAQAVEIMLEAAVAFHQSREHGFALVAERRMAEVVRKRNGFGEVGVQPQCAGDVARDGGYFNRVGEPRAQVVAGAIEKHLRLVFQPAKGARVNDAVAVALIMRAPLGRRFWDICVRVCRR